MQQSFNDSYYPMASSHASAAALGATTSGDIQNGDLNSRINRGPDFEAPSFIDFLGVGALLN